MPGLAALLVFLMALPPSAASVAASAPIAGTWTPTGSMAVARSRHTATLLPNGKVLVAGGCASDACFNAVSSAELYDPASGAWTATGSMTTARMGHTATLLPTGRVLVAGPDSSAEVYDPATGTWSSTASPPGGCCATATLLRTGQVLTTGGDGAALYDPASGMWTRTGSLATDFSFRTATLLANGRILVVGGNVICCPTYIHSAEVYNPATGMWTATGAMPGTGLNAGADAFTATLLPTGMVLVAGGCCAAIGSDFDPIDTALLYDPGTNTWTPTGSMHFGRDHHSATLLPNGTVLVAGGFHGDTPGGDIADTEVYDPGTGTWMVTGSMSNAREDHTATLLPNGQVLVAGGSAEGELPPGSTAGLLSSAELYTTVTTPPALFSDGFESGDFSAWSSVKTGPGGSATVQSSIVKSGQFAARLSATSHAGSDAYVRKAFAPAQTHLSASGDFRILAEGAGGSTVPLFRLFDPSGALLASLYRANHTNGQLWVQASGGYRRTSGSLPLNTWAHLEIYVATVGVNQSTLQVRLNGALVYQNRGLSLGTAGVSTVQLGNEAHQQVFDLVADNIVVQ